MSDKVDEYINKAVAKRRDDQLDNLLETLISEAIHNHPSYITEKEDSVEVLLEALDQYSGVLGEKAPMPSNSDSESVAQKLIDSLPKMEISERWGEPNSQTRTELRRFTENIGGKTVQDKFDELMKIQSPTSRITKPSRIIASLILLESLRSMIETSNAASAGFAFEGFLAALMNGHQVSDPADGSLPIEDVMLFTYADTMTTKTRKGAPVSLKLLKEGGVVKGSFTNMVDALHREDFADGVSYVVGFKIGQPGEDKFYVRLTENILTRKNLYQTLTSPTAKASNKDLFKIVPSRLEHLKRSQPRYEKSYGVYLESWPEVLTKKSNTITYALLQCTAGYSEAKFLKNYPPQSPPSPSITEAKESSGGSQWYINSSYYTQENVDVIGEIRLSQKEILKTAMMYSEVLKDSVAVLFSSVANLSVHINEYFVGKERSRAIVSGKEALEETRAITNTLTKDLKDS